VVIWQHNVYYVCVTFRVVRYVGLQSTVGVFVSVLKLTF